jgi:predicted RNA binding protein YcfA (HicA-like mRNA interferase family)
MKRNLLIKHLSEENCVLYREGSNHSMFRNTENGKKTAVPRHSNIDEYLAFDICKQLGIPKPKIN